MRKPSQQSKEKSTSATSRKEKLALLRRSKTSEREFARWMVKHDGPDTRMRGLTTSTGRIGHVTGIRADTLSRSFIGENKDMKLSATLARFWKLINEKAAEFGKEPIIHWHPSNSYEHKVNGKPLPDLYIIRQDTLGELLRKARVYDEEHHEG